AVDVPTLAEGGINLANAKAFKDTGVNILVVGTAIDNMVCNAACGILLYTDGRPDKPYHGKIGFVSPTAEFTPKTVETPDLRTDLV
ncbi:hypothetical protein ONO12_25935, partial [Salmonella enterica subsp. enterica serovar Montevideo]|nr:hypothetical protein [Salmonella enterica subsp. enterica serovar Montevideo]